MNLLPPLALQHFKFATSLVGVFLLWPANLKAASVIAGTLPSISQQPAGGSTNAGEAFGFTVQAEGSLPLFYQWRFRGTNLPGQTSPFLLRTNLTLEQSGNYSVVVTNGLGRAVSSNALLLVRLIAQQPVGGTNLAGSDFTFNVQAAGPTPSAYQWRLNGKNLPRQTNGFLLLTNLTLKQSGEYSVVVSSKAGRAISSNARLVVRIITEQPVGGTNIAGGQFAFSVGVGIPPPFNYQWFLNGQPLPRQTNASLVLTNLALKDSGRYHAVVGSPAGQAFSSDAVLVVQSITRQPVGGTNIVGGEFSFSVEVAGPTPFTYQWRRNGQNLSGQTNASLLLTNLALNDSGSYSVAASSPAGRAVSSNAVLEVQLITRQPVGGVAGVGEDFAFAVAAAGPPPITYQWRFRGTNLPGQTNALLLLTNLTLKQSGNYYVLVTNAAARLTSDIVGLSVEANAARRLGTGRILQNGSQVGLPVMLRANGLENAVSFSLRYDPAAYSNPTFLPTDTNALVTIDSSQPSLVGVGLALPAGQTFSPGHRVLGLAQFDLAPASLAVQGGLAFTNFPVPIAVGYSNEALLTNAADILPQYVLVTRHPLLNPQSGLFEHEIVMSNPGTTVMSNINIVAQGLGTNSGSNAITFLNSQASLRLRSTDDCFLRFECETNCDRVLDDPSDDACDFRDYLNCADGVCHFGAPGTPAPLRYAQVHNLQPGESRRATLEFFVPDRLSIPTNTYALLLSRSRLRANPIDATPMPITSRQFANGTYILIFPTQLGRQYYLQYASTLDELRTNAQTVLPPVKGTGTYIQWIDNGPPKTDTSPVEGARYYRVLQSP